MKKNKGFTLIELLVVIAIIGILASVVLASLSSARDKGKDAAVKSQLASMKAQGELYYSSTGGETYTGICGATAAQNGFAALLTAASNSAGVTNSIVSVLGTAGAWNQTTCHESADAWAVEAPMSTTTSGSPKMYCTDSTGASKETSTNLAATTGLSC